MIYFIQCGDGPIKIGYTTDLKKRLNSLQSANPFKLRVLLKIDGYEEKEKELHERFEPFRINKNREWFYPSNDLLSFIESHRNRPISAVFNRCTVPEIPIFKCPLNDNVVVDIADLSRLLNVSIKWIRSKKLCEKPIPTCGNKFKIGEVKNWLEKEYDGEY